MSHTKKALGNALKQLTHEKPFDRISVSDITSKCNLNRQTFYYHFQDKYECLEWVYLHDCLDPLTHGIGIDNWEKRIEKMLMIMSNDQEFYMRTIHATPKSFIDPCFAIFKNLFLHAIHVIDENDYVDDQEEEFISEFLAQGCVGCIISWVDKGMKMTPIDLSSKLKKIEADMEQLKKQKRKLKALRWGCNEK